jgi:hypothetical protein
MPEAAFFCCQHRHRPADFYKPAYQKHANGAIGIGEVIMVAEDPAAHARFFERLQGERAVGTDADGLTVVSGSGRIAVLTPRRFRRRFADLGAEAAPGQACFAGFQVEVENVADTRDLLARRHITFREGRADDRRPTLQIDSETAFATVIEFVAPQR